tara:strand:- start:308 stop:547 length:240 start_codon:yes stop_codon:yes gene_type:complete
MDKNKYEFDFECRSELTRTVSIRSEYLKDKNCLDKSTGCTYGADEWGYLLGSLGIKESDFDKIYCVDLVVEAISIDESI